jgi:DNA primase
MTNTTVKQIKDSLDIVSVIEKYVTLTKKGKNFAGLCPFHNEKSPSFYVTPEKKIFHCFGCGASGDVITFIMKYEHMTFSEVVTEQALALNIPNDFNPKAAKYDDRDGVRTFLNTLQLQYSEWLKNGEASIQEYCKIRQLLQQDIQQFGLGYAPEVSVQKVWLKACSDTDSAHRSGLFNSEDGYPLLNQRLIFPIHNARGIIVGFSGRIVQDTSKAKYINSPESAIFSKKKILYGMDKAKKTISKLKQCVIVEGYMDVIALHRYGFSQTVAVMGTALTNFHAKEIKKYAAQVYLMFDSDKAGMSAAYKSLAPLQDEGVGIHIVTLPTKDPGEFFDTHTQEDMTAYIKNALHYMAFYIQYFKKTMDIANPNEKSQAIVNLTNMLSKEKDKVVRDHYIKDISRQFDVSQNVVDSYLNQQHRGGAVNAKVDLKTDSKYKKAEDRILCFAISNVEFRQKNYQDIVQYVQFIEQHDLKDYFINAELVDFEFIDQINHSEIQKYLLSLIIKSTEHDLKHNSKEMEEYLDLLKQNKINCRINDIKKLLSHSSDSEINEQEILLELSTLIKQIK